MGNSSGGTEMKTNLHQPKEPRIPTDGHELGVYKYGEEFLYDMPQDAAVVLSIELVPAGSKPRRPTLEPEHQPLVIPALGLHRDVAPPHGKLNTPSSNNK
jgi:hypothetical protein